MSKKGGKDAAEEIIAMIFFLCIVAAIVGWALA